MIHRGFDFYVGGIEDGIIAALDMRIGLPGASGLNSPGAVEPEDGYLKTIGTYSGQLDADQLRKALAALTPRFPLMFVCYAEGDDKQDPRTAAVMDEPRIYRHDCTFSVICCTQDARGDRARRRGTGSQPGIYKMIADAREILGGLKFQAVVTEGDTTETLILNPEPLMLDGVDYIARIPELTAYQVHFTTYIRFAEIDRRQQGPLVQELVFTVENTYEKGGSNLPGVIKN